MPRRQTVPNKPTHIPPPPVPCNLFMGCDPGVTGAFALVHRDGHLVAVIRMDETLATVGVKLRLYRRKISYAIIEEVHGGVYSPTGRKQGVKSAFTFGDAYGCMRGMVTVCNIRHEYMRPLLWQTGMDCRTKGDKHVSKAKAEQLFPGCGVTLRTADAILIAEFARRVGIERGW